MGPELSLRAKPLKPGERRTVEHLDIDNQACHHGNDGQRGGPVELLGGSFRLLKIDMVERMAPNAQGQRVEIPGHGLDQRRRRSR